MCSVTGHQVGGHREVPIEVNFKSLSCMNIPDSCRSIHTHANDCISSLYEDSMC